MTESVGVLVTFNPAALSTVIAVVVALPAFPDTVVWSPVFVPELVQVISLVIATVPSFAGRVAV